MLSNHEKHQETKAYSLRVLLKSVIGLVMLHHANSLPYSTIHLFQKIEFYVYCRSMCYLSRFGDNIWLICSFITCTLIFSAGDVYLFFLEFDNCLSPYKVLMENVYILSPKI